MKDFLTRLLGVAGACLTGSVALTCAAATDPAPGKDFWSTVAALGWTNVGNGLPAGAGQSVAIEIPGLPHGAKKLELVLVPGRDRVKPFLMGKYEVTQAQYEAVIGANPSSRRLSIQLEPKPPVSSMKHASAFQSRHFRATAPAPVGPSTFRICCG